MGWNDGRGGGDGDEGLRAWDAEKDPTLDSALITSSPSHTFSDTPTVRVVSGPSEALVEYPAMGPNVV